jgi:PKD repeat protein
VGLVFDYLDNKNYSLIWINGYSAAIQLQKIVNGVTTTVHTGTLSMLSYDTWYHFKAILRSNALTVEINGVKAIDAYNYGTVVGTRVGLYISQSSALFDNFIVKRDASLDGNTAPQVTISANLLEGSAPLEVTFTSTVTDKENDIPLTYVWNFGDGTPTSAEENPIHNFTTTGLFTVTLSVTDSGVPPMTGSDDVTIDISNYSTIFSDNFNDGNISDWNNLSGAIWSLYQVAANSYRLAGATVNTGTILAPAASEFNNGNIIEFDFLFRSGQVASKKKFGFYFDYQSSTTYALLRLNYELNTIDIYKYVNGAGSLVFSGTLTSKVFDTWYHFKASMTSGLLTVSISGTKVVDGLNYGTVTSNTNGLWIWGASMFFDDYITKEIIP